IQHGCVRRHGVLVRRHEGSTEMFYRKTLYLPVDDGVRRNFSFAGKPVELDEAEFNTALALAYESQRGAAAEAADNLDGLDLSSLADAMPETSDLDRKSVV